MAPADTDIGPWPAHLQRETLSCTNHQEGNPVDNPAVYVHLGFIEISLPNLALIGAMIVLFVAAILAPFPREGGRGGGGT
jgi:hypothetical protein